MTVIIEREGRILVGARARLITDDKELAWAERFVRQDPDLKWILGNFVEADNANDNGHVFPLADLKTAQATIANKPLNMLHVDNYIVGSFAGAEMLYPTGEDAAAKTAFPYVEALAAFWRSNFPDEYAAVEKAHKEGSLFYSMECIPESLRCPLEECGVEAAYAGRQHESYCAHMNAPRGGKILNKPHFNAGALILPPTKPGWRGAGIGQIAEYINQQADEAERVYASIEKEFSHLDPEAWEQLMLQVMVAAMASPEAETMKKKPHMFKASKPDPEKCAICGGGKDAPCHSAKY